MSLMNLFNDLDDSNESRENYLKAPFSYPGSKWRSLEKILPLLPNRKCFVDVFGGSGVISLNRKPCQLHVYNDRHSGLVSFYRCVRDTKMMDELVRRLELTIHSREEFIWCRDTWQDVTDDVERAARWYYMLQVSFGRIGRNYGRTINNPPRLYIHKALTLFGLIHEKAKTWQVENADWRHILKDYDGPDTVFYCDPPYLETDAGAYTFGFCEKDHIELAEAIQHLKGYCALSGYENHVYNRYTWTHKEQWEVDTPIGANSDNYKKSTEVLWIHGDN